MIHERRTEIPRAQEQQEKKSKLNLCVCCFVVLAVLQQGLRTQCCSSDEKSSAVPLFSHCLPSNAPFLQPFLQSPQPPSPHHSPVLVSFPHTSCSLPACTLPLWSMCCAPAETCWGSRKREYLQISQMGLSSAPILHTHSSSSITATTATHSQGHCYTNTGILATLNLSTQTFSLTSLSIHILKPFQAS